MLALPISPCQKDEDLSPVFKQYVDSQVSIANITAEIQSVLESDFVVYKQCREKAVSTTEASDLTTQLVMRYHHHMSSISPRFDGYESDIKITFRWFDAFRPRMQAVCYSFYFDWGNVLWNYAAFESLKAARIDRSTDEGVRAAHKSFQQSAGVLDFIKDNIMAHIKVAPVPYTSGGTLPQLTTSGLVFGRELMLAQAQLCFYEKAVRDKKASGAMKPGVIAKLAAQVSVFYKSAIDACAMDPLRLMIDPSWVGHLEFQESCFSGCAEYWQSIASKEAASERGSGYGEEIGRLARAEKLLLAALDVGQRLKLSPTLTCGAEVLMRAVKTAKAAAERDNNAIYMERVPVDASIAVVAPVSMVRSSPMPEININERPLFKDLIPKSIKIISETAKDAITDALRVAQTAADNATSEARVALSSVGLPGSLEAYKAGGGLPDALWQKLSKIQGLGGTRTLEGKHSELEAAARRSQATLDSISESLRSEERSDEAFRVRNKSYRGVQPSAALNADFKSHAAVMREAFDKARASDSAVTRALSDASFRDAARLLELSREDVTGLMPQTPHSPLLDFEGLPNTGHGVGIDTSRLERCLGEMAGIIEARDRVLREVAAVAAEDFNSLLLKELSSGSDPNKLSMQKVSACQDQLQSLAAQAARQAPLLEEIVKENEIFKSKRTTDGLTMEREKVIVQLEQTVTKYFSLHAQLNTAITFYSNLQSRLAQILQSSDDLAYTQQLQRQDFELNASSEAERLSQEERDLAMARQMQGGLNISGGPAVPTVVSPSAEQQSFQASLGAYPTLPTPHANTPIIAGQPTPAPNIASPPKPPRVAQDYSYNTLSTYPGSPLAPNPNPAPTLVQAQQPADRMAKAMRLAEMGFPVDMCVSALGANGDDEEAALNSLLSSGSVAPSAPPPPQQQQQQSKPSGFFGSTWGTKK